MRNRINNSNEFDVYITQEFIDSIDTDKEIQIVKEPAFTDVNGNLKVLGRYLATPEGYMPESYDEDLVEKEAEQVVKFELSNHIKEDVAYLMKYRYLIDEQTRELKVVIHGIY